MRIKDLTGQRFGSLTALRMGGRRGTQNQICWHVRCDCGTEREVLGAALRSGNTTSCGCVHTAPDRTGQRFGRLVAVREAFRARGGVRWSCQCDCGGEKVVLATDLTKGRIRSCGCEARESWAAAGLARRGDLTDRRFGRLVAVSPLGRAGSSVCMWRCQCDCGAQIERSSSDLTRGRSRSCGCHVQDRKALVNSLDYRRKMQATRQANRRAAKAGAGGKHTQAEVDALLIKQGHRCANPACGADISERYHRDHIMPIALGGHSGIENIQLLCVPCNCRKSDRHPDEWLAEEMRRAA